MTLSSSICVIGAGVAGLAAADTLRAAGHDVLVLEGRERIGGRIWTVRDAHATALDLGAQWIVGTHENPILDLARRWDVRTIQTDWLAVALFTATRRRMPTMRLRALEARLSQLLEQVRHVREEARAASQPDRSLRAVVDELVRAMRLSARARAELDFILATDVEHEFAADLDDLSLYHWDREGRLGGGELLLPDGYDELAARLASGLDIRLGHVVRQIAVTDAGVVIHTSRGDVVAERAIVTVPLGVLQAGAIEFSPALPARKRHAIRALRVGLLDKVFLRFPRVFWPEDDVLGQVSARRGEWPWFINLHKSTGQPWLVGLNAGRYAHTLEAYDDHAIIAAAMGALRAMLGDSAPDPEAWHITRWAADPFAYGSYSHIPPGGSSEDYDALAEPVGERLFFAGEATACQYAGTVHGAYLSGLREAHRLRALTTRAPG
jgi:monoamine oxidase